VFPAIAWIVDRNADLALWNLAVGGHVTAMVFCQYGSARCPCGVAAEGAAISYMVGPIVLPTFFLCGPFRASLKTAKHQKLWRGAGMATSKALVDYFLPFALPGVACVPPVIFQLMHGGMSERGDGSCRERGEARAGEVLSFGVVYLTRLVKLSVRTARWASRGTLIGTSHASRWRED
jgi:hypothetical protein